MSWDRRAAWQDCLDVQMVQDIDRAMRTKVKEANHAENSDLEQPEPPNHSPGKCKNAKIPLFHWRFDLFWPFWPTVHA